MMFLRKMSKVHSEENTASSANSDGKHEGRYLK